VKFFFKSVNIWQSYKQERGCLMHFAHLANTLLKDEESARDNPPHLKYVATLPCNISSMDCFADVNVAQGNVATYARSGGIFNMDLTANLPRNLAIKKFVNRLRFDRIMVMTLWPRFWPTLYVKKIHRFLSSTKKTRTKENWFLFLRVAV